MKNFREIASAELSLSPLATGRAKVDTQDLIGKELTIVAFDFATIIDEGTEKTFPILLFKEMPDKYYCGGILLSKLCSAWAAEYGGDIESASNDLGASGGVAVRFKATRTKSGNNLTTIEVV